MKILVIHSLYKEKGGEDVVVENERLLLEQNGYDVKVLYFSNEKNTAFNLMMMPFNLAAYRKVIHELSTFKPDLVHLHNLHFAASPSVLWAIRRKKIPVVKTLHNYRLLCPSGTLFHNNDLYYNSLYSSFPWQAVKDRVYRGSALLTLWLALSMWLHRRIGTFKYVNRYLALNEKSRDIFLASRLKLQSHQVLVKPNFVTDENNYRLASGQTRKPQFLFIGRLSPEKGIDILVKAFALNGLPLTIIGDGPMRDEVKKLQQVNLRVRWLGYQTKEVINRELKQCTALIVPSVCLEGMPLTLVEGFALSTPAIASNLGGMATIISHNNNGLLFTPNDVSSLNEQISRWMALPDEAKRKFETEARLTYERKYTPEKNFQLLASVYRDTIAGKIENTSVHNAPLN